MPSRTEVPSRKDEKITLKVKDELLLFPPKGNCRSKTSFCFADRDRRKGAGGNGGGLTDGVADMEGVVCGPGGVVRASYDGPSQGISYGQHGAVRRHHADNEQDPHHCHCHCHCHCRRRGLPLHRSTERERERLVLHLGATWKTSEGGSAIYTASLSSRVYYAKILFRPFRFIYLF